MQNFKKIAVVVPFHGHGKDILLGVSRFAHTHSDWVLHLIQSDSPLLTERLKQWEPDGIISGMLDNDAGISRYHYKRPWVSVLAQPDNPEIPFVTIDEDAVGRMAADYYLNRRFHNFAFIGNSEHEFSTQRADAFEYALKEHRLECSTLLYPTKVHNIDRRQRAKIDRQKELWLKQLPKPVAVFACDDWEAFQLIQVCRRLGYRVPEDIAVMGVGNEETFCKTSNPPLSSIQIPCERTGYDAAGLLDALLNKKRILNKKNFLPPSGLVSRRSTDVLQVNDPVILKALQFIQENIGKPIQIKDVLKHVFVSQSLLERKFREELERTPLAEIRRQRIQRARQLLSDTNLSQAEIAEACGFSSDVRFSAVFKEITGTSPSAFRKAVKTPSFVHDV